jgi:flagellar assembly protein FliH
MHPLDMEVLAEDLRSEFADGAINLVADAGLSRGGCLAEAAGTVIDGTVQRRWKRAVSGLGLDLAWETEHDGH